MNILKWIFFGIINIVFTIFIVLAAGHNLSSDIIVFISGVSLFIFDVLFFLFVHSLKKETLRLQDDLENTRTELTKTIEEIDKYTSELEEKNKRMTILEQDSEDAQEQLTEIVSELSIHSKQIEDILNNVDEGICTISADLKIDANFNSQLRAIFGDREYWEQSILDTIFNSFDAKTKSDLKEFIDMIFSNTSVSLEMLNDANPAKNFTYIYNQDGKVENKEILMSVVPIKNDHDEVEKIMLIFRDVTYERALEKSLEAEKQEYQNELDLITTIFRNEKSLILEFINELPETKEMIQKIIDSIEMDTVNKDTIYRLTGLIHSLKGEAMALELQNLGKFCQTFENYLKTIAEQPIDLTKNMEITNYQITINQRIDEIIETSKKLFQFSEETKEFSANRITFSIAEYNKLLQTFDEFFEQFQNQSLTPEKIQNFREQLGHFTWMSLSHIEKELQLLSEKTAAKLNKDVKLQFMFEIDSLPQAEYKLLKESFIHLVRNSIAHGIEEKEERLKNSKPEQGRINIHITKEDDKIIVYYSDDGAGFNPEKIKQKALEKGLITEDKAASMTNEELIQLIFSDGFSTQSQGDEISGTGVGMSVVKNNIVNFLHGKIVLENKAPNGMGLKLTFPAPK